MPVLARRAAVRPRARGDRARQRLRRRHRGDGRRGVPGRPAARPRREPRLRRRSQPRRRGGARRVRAAAQPGHGRARRCARQARRLCARAPRARALRRPDARSRRDRQPGVVLGAAVALEPRLLRDHAVDGVQGLAALRPRGDRRLEARHRPRGGDRDGLPAARAPCRCGGSSAASTRASSCTARTLISACAPGRKGCARRSRRTR